MTMFQITVTMDRVFSKASFRTRNELHTEFGFESAGKKYYGVQVPGSPRIEEGMTVTMLLREEGDWTSVCGWVDMRSGEVTPLGIGQAVFVAYGSLLTSILASIGARDPAVLLFGLPFLILYPTVIVPRRRIRRTLQEIYAQSSAPPENSNPA